MSIEDKINRWIRPQIRRMAAYHVPPATGMIKLDAMENPWDWPQELRDAWLSELETASINRYPDPAASDLGDALREAMGVPAGAAILLGNGSDELIQMIIQAVAEPGHCIMAPMPTFVMYRQIAEVCGLEFHGIPLADDFALDTARMLETVRDVRPAVVFLAYPNNPTGNLFDAAAMRALLEASDGLIVVDEAYAPFTDASFMDELGSYDNLLVLRTVSKLGLAGLRLGLLAGAPAWIEEFDKVRLPYNIGTLNQLTGTFALRHREVFAAQATDIRAERVRLDAQLRAPGNFEVFPSEANFILFRTPAGRAGEIHAGLQASAVLVKNLDGSTPALQDCLRVTVGRPDENDAFLATLQGLV